MSRQISQTNISAYFNQPIYADFQLYRNSDSLPIGKKEVKYDKCLTGICTAGKAELTMLGQKHTLQPNEIFCILPGHLVAINNIDEEFTAHFGVISERFMKDITSRFPNVMFDYLTAHPTMKMTPIAMDEATRYIDLIESKMNEKNNLFQKDIVFNILYSYILDLYNMINRDLPNLPLGKTATERLFDKFTVLAYHHLNENMPVSYYANALNITPKYLNKVVKTIKGSSVKQWLDEMMTQELKRVLLNTQLSILEISDRYSFSSSDAMHHFFKKHTGTSPSEYRQQKKK